MTERKAWAKENARVAWWMRAWRFLVGKRFYDEEGEWVY